MVYVKHYESRPIMLMIVIENVGNTSASDLTFTLSLPIPAEAHGLTEEAAAAHPAKSMTTGPLIEGVPTLGRRTHERSIGASITAYSVLWEERA
jgi:hypothetical protein